MHGEFVHPSGAEAADAGVVPDIGPIASGLNETEVVGVRFASDLEGEDQLVLGAIEGPHAAIGLVPDAEVLHFRKDVFARVEEFPHVAPVHADEGDGAVFGCRCGLGEGLLEERRELAPRHLSGGEGELPVPDRAEPRNMAVDRHVVGRVGEDEVGRLLPDEPGDMLG